MNRVLRVVLPVFVMGGMLVLSACTSEDSGTYPSEWTTVGENGTSGSSVVQGGCKILSTSETIRIGGVSVDVRIPEGKYQGDILLLTAWDESRNAWCKHSRFCSKALQKGYRLIMPEMGKSIYAQATYPETRKDWRMCRTLPWVVDTLIETLQEDYCLLKEKGNNFMIGVSAGARGAVRVATELPGLFVAIAALSGDYNPAMLKGDNIYRGFFGRYDDHPVRWAGSENVLKSMQDMRTPVYLGHGRKDPLVPYEQTEALYNALRRAQPDLNVRLNVLDDQQHGFVYWKSEISNMLRFFESMQANRPESP